MARSMLKGKNLPNEYWAKAVACAVYILNRIQQRVWQTRFHNKHGVVRTTVFLILEYLVVLDLHMCLKKQEVSWMIRVKNAFLLAMMNILRDISCLIL